MKSLRLLALVSLVACSGDASDLAMQFPQTPFRELRGVTLGMGGNDLHRLRPAAVYQPYGGLQENFPGLIVTFSLPTAVNDSRDARVTNLDKLLAVYATEMFDAMEPAEAKWRDKVREIAGSRGAPTRCESFATGGAQAKWTVGKNTFVVGVFPREPMAPAVGPRVIYALSPTEALKEPEGGNAVTCPNS